MAKTNRKVHFDDKYLLALSVEELREEVRDWWQFKGELRAAIKEAVPMPGGWMLKMLSGFGAKYPEDWEKGKELQNIYDDLPADDPRRANGQIRENRYEIPFKTECEQGAGLWWRIRRGLTGANNG